MQTTQNKLKVNRINVYLNGIDRKILNEIRDKYHLSYSTIANIIMDKIVYGNNARILSDHYIYEKDNSTKTSIKPRHASKETYFGSGEWPITMMFTNGIKLFTRNEMTKYLGIDEKEQAKIKSQIYNEFQNTYDPNWNGNEWNRRIPKLIKANKEYYKKLLEDM